MKGTEGILQRMQAFGEFFREISGWPGALAEGLAHVFPADWSAREALLVALSALVIERIVGWPDCLQRLSGHPVQWIGAMIGRLERALNAPGGRPALLRLKGAGAVLFVLVFWGAAALLLARAAAGLWPARAWLAQAALAAPFLAQSSLRRHVRAVCLALENGGADLTAARREVGRIVGRETAGLDASGVARAAIESLSENASDGIVAPAFWLALFGLPGLVVYKAANTADSMIGHRTERHAHFGWFAARLDDALNWIPARLTGLLFAMAAALTAPRAGTRALHVMWRDARLNASPNAGWPEAAVAGALDISLGGPRIYAGRAAPRPWIGDGREALSAADIRRALSLYGQMLTLMTLLGFAVWLFMPG